MLTLKDIAKRAGVSKATVSNVLNGNLSKVSEQTARVVRTLMTESGYVPNMTARSLSNKSSRIISLIVYADPWRNVLSDPYIALFAGELLIQLQKRGYFGMIRTTNDYADILQNLNAWNSQGVIFFGTLDKDIREMQDETGIPFVFTDSYSSVRRINNVGIDDYRGGMIAAEHLLAMGHREVSFIAPGLDTSDVDNQRMAGFVDRLSRAGITLDKTRFYRALANHGEQMARYLLSLTGVTAAFVTADIIAIELMKALASLSVDVPSRMSVIGFDDIPLSSLVTPALTTIRQDVTQKAQVAVEILLRHLADPSCPNESTILDVSLVSRQSVASLGAAHV